MQLTKRLPTEADMFGKIRDGGLEMATPVTV